jgi:hypothetical protein
MVYEEWEHECHFTLSGWVAGRLFFGRTLAPKMLRLIDRVLTLVQENMSSSSHAEFK